MNSREFFDLTAIVMMLENKINNTEDIEERERLSNNRKYFWDKLWYEIRRVSEIIGVKED